MKIAIIVIIVCICIIVIGSILWWRHDQREELWRRWVRVGDTLIVVLEGRVGEETSWWYKSVGKKIVDKSDDGVRLQHIGWIDKSRFLDTAYIYRYGRLCYRKRK